MTISTLEEKFSYHLSTLYDAEHRFLEAQWLMQQYAGAQILITMLAEHSKQTEEHIRNLAQVWEIISENPQRIKSEAAAGLVHDCRVGLKEVVPGSPICDVLIMETAMGIERFEIASYHALMMVSKELGYEAVADVLYRNLQQEESMVELHEEYLPDFLTATISQTMSQMVNGPLMPSLYRK